MALSSRAGQNGFSSQFSSSRPANIILIETNFFPGTTSLAAINRFSRTREDTSLQEINEGTHDYCLKSMATLRRHFFLLMYAQERATSVSTLRRRRKRERRLNPW